MSKSQRTEQILSQTFQVNIIMVEDWNTVLLGRDTEGWEKGIFDTEETKKEIQDNYEKMSYAMGVQV